MPFKVFSKQLFDALNARAAQSPRRRQHHNIHDAYSDPCQRLFNAVGVDSYIRPHRHALDPKDECLVAIKGLFGLVVFSEQGEVSRVERFGSEAYADSAGKEGGVAFGVELPAGTWHTVVALQPGSILLELKAGPFNPEAAKELAPWAPEEGSAEAETYLSHLKSLF